MKKSNIYTNTILGRAARHAARLALTRGIHRAVTAMRCLLLAGMIPGFCCSMAKAQIIYSNPFNGGTVNMNRQTPPMSTNYAGGAQCVWWTSESNSATAYLLANGTIGTSRTTFLLPFTPLPGYVYTLTASVTVPTMTAGKWITMGFAQYIPPINTCVDPRFGSTEINGNPWTYLTEGSGGDFFFPTRGTSTGNAQLMPSPGTYTVQLVLNTTGSSWTAAEYVDGAQVGSTYTYSSNPLITGIGVGQTTLSSSAGIQWNYLTLSATGSGSVNTVSGNVSFSGTGKALNPAFGGLSYDKAAMTATNRFTTNNLSLLGVFSLLNPCILRLGGGTVDTTGWNGISNTIPITASEVDQLAGFVKALPPGWQVIYGINFLHNTPDNCEAEAVYAANALGSRLYGFEIGNEPEFYISGDGYTYNSFLSQWRLLAAAITNHVAGWAVTNGGNGWILDGADAGQGQLAALTDPFAGNESGVVSLLTQHYYGASSGLSSDTMQTMLKSEVTSDPTLMSLTTNIVGAANGRQSLGARITESGSYSGGGIVGISDAYGSGLWALDEMFTAAQYGCQGVNFHGGGFSPYSPVVDGNGGGVIEVEPGFYALGMMDMVPAGGSVVPASISGGAASIDFSAYGVYYSTADYGAVLNNKEVNDTVSATVTLGTNVASVGLFQMTAPQLFCTNQFTIGGASIATNGAWSGGVQSIIKTSNGQLTISVPPITADLLIPVSVGTKPAAVTAGPDWNLEFTLATGPADFIYHYGSSNDTHFVMGDWDGNGTMTPGVVRDTGGQWEWLLGNSDGGGAAYDFFFGDVEPGDVLVVGDWDGDGKWTPGIVRTNNTGGALIWLMTNTNLVSGSAGTNYDFQYGDAGDTPLVGDWDGNGTFTPGAVKAGSNTWDLRNENSGGDADISFAYGNGTGIPIVGDWDGNGTWTCGIIEGNTWELRNSNTSGNAQIVFGYGSPGDTFLVWK
ncbi:MAG TPA: hypothetical protein VGY98_09220 [Verrucomicrobiae bacterium]|nr:hypothetical protein [Verrucomicrobiae bacterium]